ncbi:hypothetical protein D3C84_1119590 [compost metagenome]
MGAGAAAEGSKVRVKMPQAPHRRPYYRQRLIMRKIDKRFSPLLIKYNDAKPAITGMTVSGVTVQFMGVYSLKLIN